MNTNRMGGTKGIVHGCPSIHKLKKEFSHVEKMGLLYLYFSDDAFTFFAGATSQEAFAGANNQRWIYVTVYYVCSSGDIYSEYTSRTLETWTNENHPAPTRKWEQVCFPLWDGGIHCEHQWVYRHTSHLVDWHNAVYYSYTRATRAHGCR